MTLADYSLTINGTYILRLYLWSMLRKYMPEHWDFIQNESGANELVIPIIPHQDQPETQRSEKPYMVYTYDFSETGDLFQYQRETFTVRIYSQSTATLAATTKFIMRLFNRYDESAFDVNAWLHDLVPGRDTIESDYMTGRPEFDKWIDEAKNYIFKVVKVSGVEGAQPTTGEGNRVDAMIVIDMEYVEKDMGPFFGGELEYDRKASDEPLIPPTPTP